MPPRLNLRHRIGLLVAMAAIALVIVTIVTLVLGRRSQRQLTEIENRYVPLLELDRDVKRTFEGIPKALEDAATAAQDSKLGDADLLAAELKHRLGAGASEISDNGGDPKALERAFSDYYRLARPVSEALVAGTNPAQLTANIEEMRRARSAFTAQLDAATTPDRHKLAAAVATARGSQNEALASDIAVAIAALAVMMALSWRLIRRTVSSLQAVSDGLERLARGDFDDLIDVPPGDEIGDLAREANRTASRLRELRDQAQSLLAETQRQAQAAETANKELDAFSYSVSHDLRAPLRAIDGFSQALVEDEAGNLSPKANDYLQRIRAAAQRMAELIDDLLELSRVSRGDFQRESVDLTATATAVIAELQRGDPERKVAVTVQEHVLAEADSRLIRITLENLLDNAWKFTANAAAAEIEFGVRDGDGERVYFVRDNGAGFDMKYVDRLFGAFQRLHTDKEFPGTGIGLATVQRIVLRHGGRIWAEAAVDKGATFHFTLPG